MRSTSSFVQLLLLAVFVAIIISVCAEDYTGRKKMDGDFEFADEDDMTSTKKEGKKTWILDPGSDLCQALKCKKKELCLLEDEFTAVCVSKKELHKNGDVIVPKSKVKADPSKFVDNINNNKEDVDEDEDDDSDYYDDDLDSAEAEDAAFFSDVAKAKAKAASAKTSAPTSPAAKSAYRNCSPCPVVKPTFLCGSDNKTYSSLCRLDYHNCIQTARVTVVCKGFCPCKDQEELAKRKKLDADRMGRYVPKYKQTIRSDQDQTEDVPDKYRPKFIKSKASDDSKFFGRDFNSASPLAGGAKDRYYSGYPDYTGKKASSSKQRSYNDVLNTKPFSSRDCGDDALESMGNRLLDWFSVVMADTLKRKSVRRRGNKQVRFPDECKSEVQWMFQHLNADGDDQLSMQELFDLENDKNEKCIKPFIDRCDTDKDIFVSPEEWCRCFAKSDRPCQAVKRKTSGGLLGSYLPQCDGEGYYKPTQCHSSIGLCWCVDKHGVEFANTRTRGKPSCGSFQTREDNDTDDDDDTDMEGSADGPLEI